MERVTPDEKWDWHPTVRERGGAQAHFFWRFGFHTIYRPEPTVAVIVEILRQVGVKSYIIHEYFGPLDIVVEGWIPFKDRNAIRHLLSETLRPSQSDLFEVSRTLIDTNWCTGEFPELSEDTDARWLDSQLVTALNSGKAQPDLIQSFLSSGLIRPVQEHQGIPFMIAISNFERSTDHQREVLESKLKELVAERHPEISHLRLLSGQGFGSHVITGNVSQGSLHEELSGLVDAINAKAGLGEFVPVRSFTSIAGRLKPLAVRYGLVVDEALAEEAGGGPSADQLSVTMVADLLSEEESDTLEVKASAFAHVKRWVTEGALVRSKDVEHAIAETICAFLNSSTGGTLVIGAVERRPPFYDGGRQEWHDKLGRFPEYGKYRCIGNELDLEVLNQSRGTILISWDDYQRQVQDIIRRFFDRGALPWITISRELFHGQEMCRVAIRPPTVGWYYLKDDAKLHVREGNTTQGLIGTYADDYRAAYPRVMSG